MPAITWMFIPWVLLASTATCTRRHQNSQIAEIGFISQKNERFKEWHQFFGAKFNSNQQKKGLFWIFDREKKRRKTGKVIKQGVAFLISKDGYLLTAFHTIFPCYRKYGIQKCPKKQFALVHDAMQEKAMFLHEYRIVAVGEFGSDQRNDRFDAALIKIDAPGANVIPMKLAAFLPQLPLRVFTVGVPIPKYSPVVVEKTKPGHPFVRDTFFQDYRFATGILTLTRKSGNLLSTVIADSNTVVDSFGGNSGAPVFDANGLVFALHYSDKKYIDHKGRIQHRHSHLMRNVSSKRIIESFKLKEIPSVAENIITRPRPKMP